MANASNAVALFGPCPTNVRKSVPLDSRDDGTARSLNLNHSQGRAPNTRAPSCASPLAPWLAAEPSFDVGSTPGRNVFVPDSEKIVRFKVGGNDSSVRLALARLHTDAKAG